MYKKQIQNLIKNIDKKDQPIELDIVLEGGAFNGLYEIGAMLFIKELENQQYIRVNRISGASIGSLVGFCYYTNKLEEIIDSYQNLREHWRENLNLEYYGDYIKSVFNDLNDEIFETIKTKRLYINYNNIDNFENIVQCEYENKDDLMNAILKSSHIPHITTHDMCQERFFIDGGQPFIFHNREKTPNYNVLYISINNLSKLSSMVNAKDINGEGKILVGILEAYHLFHTGEKNNLCSFLHQWSTYDYTTLRLKQLILKIVIFVIYIYYKCKTELENNTYFKNFLEKYISETYLQHGYHVFSYFNSLFKDVYTDLVLQFCFK